ncbi:hypothetical protein Y032_0125g1270 [Ancylostoma ceylanicum]|uniref:Uncharacterized protein n=1 Tax=Ancylostoma ceylanicum TaxID=53326 RepID=A0A016T8S9_9BILA|nr:hypothetical protein Y032_0125g1270 [Ancylostoma ceylanicum]
MFVDAKLVHSGSLGNVIPPPSQKGFMNRPMGSDTRIYGNAKEREYGQYDLFLFLLVSRRQKYLSMKKQEPRRG